MKQVLFVTMKWPYASFSTDGGDSTTRELIEALRGACHLHVLCFRDEEPQTIDGVKVTFIPGDYHHYETYQLHGGEKFTSRLEEADLFRRGILRYAAGKDVIVLQHDMLLLALKEETALLQRMVLFPMFTGRDYERAGDVVPATYLSAEQRVLPSVRRIITPSVAEKEDIEAVYGVDHSHIVVIPRTIGEGFQAGRKSSVGREQKTACKWLYVASVRRQKCHEDAVRLVHCLTERGVDAHMRFVGSVQDKGIRDACCKEARRLGIDDRVQFSGIVPPSDIPSVYHTADFNISVAQWETFGRGIFEGMASGLPTVVLRRLACLRGMPCVPLCADTVEDMADMIAKHWRDEAYYQSESHRCAQIGSLLRPERIYSRLRQVILEAADGNV